MNRGQLQQLAEDRLLDVEALLGGQRWSAAYYLAGYAIECGLKACVLAYVQNTGVIFRDKKFSEKCWTHNIEELVAAADLKSIRDSDASANNALGANWQIVKDWNEISRYEQKTEAKARRLYEAVAHNVDGVLPWLRVRW